MPDVEPIEPHENLFSRTDFENPFHTHIRVQVGNTAQYYNTAELRLSYYPGREGKEESFIFNYPGKNLGIIPHDQALKIVRQCYFPNGTSHARWRKSRELHDVGFPEPIYADPPIYDSAGRGDPGAWALLELTVRNVIVVCGWRPELHKLIFQWYTVVVQSLKTRRSKSDTRVLVHIPPEAYAKLMPTVLEKAATDAECYRLACMLPEDGNAKPFQVSTNLRPSELVNLREEDYFLPHKPDPNGGSCDVIDYGTAQVKRNNKISYVDVKPTAMMQIASGQNRLRKMKILSAYGHSRIGKRDKALALKLLSGMSTESETLRDAKATAATSIVSNLGSNDNLVHKANMVVAEAEAPFDASSSLTDVFGEETMAQWA